MSKQELTPDWLKDLERTSWQIELLISGGLIFILYSLPTYINEGLLSVFINTDFNASSLILFIAAFVVAKVLLIGFGVNLLLRALWLALLGVHFSYPDGIDYERLNYSDTFREQMQRKPSTLRRILWLERWSSLCYSIAITLTVGAFGSILMVSGIYYFVFERILPESWLESQLFGYLVLLVVSLVSFGFVDRVVYRRLRNNAKASRRYFRFSQVINTLNFTRLFQRESLTILSNNPRWKIHLINLSYFAVAIIISLNDITLENDVVIRLGLLDGRDYTNLTAYHYAIDNREYDDLLQEGDLIRSMSIPSEVIRSNSLPVFVTYDEYFDRTISYMVDSLELELDFDKVYNSRELLRRNTRGIQVALNEMLPIKLNGEVQDSLRWFFREHPLTDQEGFFTRLDITNLEEGEVHDLIAFYVPVYRDRTDTSGIAWIPFWKE